MHLIRRTQPTSDVTPPWAGMSFTQPVDSDALHERLKKAYPTCATLRQRKHMAAIDFLTTELREMQSKDQNVATTEHSADYPALASSEAPSIFSETLEGGSRQGSPSVLESPASSAHHSRSVERVLQRQDSPPASAHLVRTQPSTTGSGQHIVFSAKDGRTLQPKLKRKMTTEEKTAYKETRKRGACPKCKRQKGKCTHTVDTSKDPGSSEDVKRPSKRRPPSSPALEQPEANKMPKREPAPDARQLTPNVLKQNDPSMLESSISNHKANGILDDSGMDLGDMQWERSTERDRPEMPGYVNREAPLDNYGTSLSGNPRADWNSFPTSAGIHSFNSGYSGFLENPGQSEPMFPLSPSRNDLPSEFSFPPDYSGYESWTGRQEPRSGDTNPD